MQWTARCHGNKRSKTGHSMIPLTASEIRALVEARDVLHTKITQSTCGDDVDDVTCVARVYMDIVHVLRRRVIDTDETS